MLLLQATLTSVGYGDISGNTVNEKCFLIFMMLAGAVIYALILALMTSVMQQVSCDVTRRPSLCVLLKS